jgi:hypothetical protein
MMRSMLGFGVANALAGFIPVASIGQFGLRRRLGCLPELVLSNSI